MLTIANVAAGSKSYGPRLCEWLRVGCPDIVTLQKPGSSLPVKDLRKLGYETEVPPSSKPHLGVAVLSRRDLPHKPALRARDLPDAEGESRFLTVHVGGLYISSVSPHSVRR